MKANTFGLVCLFFALFLNLSLGAKKKRHFRLPETNVFLNGTASKVFFNDGDSFRVLDGPFKDTKARIAGFNTLESYGPVHSWGNWSEVELLHFAKLGTLNAQKGEWHCRSDMDKDIYGRLLWHCDDLALSQIGYGFAHAMTADKNPAAQFLLDAQVEAQEKARGIWAKGIPDFILTSAHSSHEAGLGTEGAYNRFVSTKDGYSEKVYHNNFYEKCSKVCPSTLAQLDSQDSCIIYVAYDKRFGRERPECLNKRY